MVYRLTPEEKEKRELLKKVEDKEKVERYQVGFYKPIHALLKANKGLLNLTPQTTNKVADSEYDQVKENLEKCRKIPIIVHNGLLDLLFFLTHFHDPVLPASWIEAKLLISSHFPLIYDTTYIVSECPCGECEQTDLASLYLKLHEGESAKNAHDAGFDSFMKG